MIEGLENLTPKEIVEALDKYIIGQDKAKKAVAIALRNRMRRQKLPQEMREEIAPKNIIMIGPTGVGKTEIARRLSKLVNAPFIKIEATKYTEVGYVGRDVESMIRDLMSVAVAMVKKEFEDSVRDEAEKRTEDAILDLLLPGVGKKRRGQDGEAGGISLGSIFSAMGGNQEKASDEKSEAPQVINLPVPERSSEKARARLSRAETQKASPHVKSSERC